METDDTNIWEQIDALSIFIVLVLFYFVLEVTTHRSTQDLFLSIRAVFRDSDEMLNTESGQPHKSQIAYLW